MTTFDKINKAEHYNVHPSGVECIEVVEHHNFNVGNAIKYLWRCAHKGAHLDDLKKARYYVDREIQRVEKDSKSRAEKPCGCETLYCRHD